MRSLRLLEVAAEAEGLRLRRIAAGSARSAALVVVAAVFGFAVLCLLHAALWMELAARQDALAATLWLAALDAVIVLALLLMARRRRDPIGVEALALRRAALAELGRLSPVGEALSLFRPRRASEEVGLILFEGLLRRLTRR